MSFEADDNSIGSADGKMVTPRPSSTTANCLDSVKRVYTMLLAGTAIALSILVCFSCEFFSYRTLDGQPWVKLPNPFDRLSQASVGLFSFTSTVANDGIELSITDGNCVEYEEPWEVGRNDFWVTAQYASIAAPAVGFLASFQMVLEMVFCRLRCSSVLIPILFFAASALQGCTFMIFAEREFWYVCSAVHCSALRCIA